MLGRQAAAALAAAHAVSNAFNSGEGKTESTCPDARQDETCDADQS